MFLHLPPSPFELEAPSPVSKLGFLRIPLYFLPTESVEYRNNCNSILIKDEQKNCFTRLT